MDGNRIGANDVRRLSRFADHLLTRHPEWEAELAPDAGPWQTDALDALLGKRPPVDEPLLRRQLRHLRNRMMLRTMSRDLRGEASLDEVFRTLSDFADRATAIAARHGEAEPRRQHGQPRDSAGRPIELEVIAMGKLGGEELNASSDIDIVLLYAEDGDTDGERPVSNHEFFARVARRIVSLLSEQDEDGFVFRVDLRLRPWGDAGPLVCSHAALEQYFVAHGREWERYAWLKARRVPGTGGEDARLRALVHPFVYRRYFDYSTLSALRQLHAEITRDARRRDRLEDLKLGPGGIREIEFIAQALQIVRGGREPDLAVRPTRMALERLAMNGALGAEAASRLREAYDFLRSLEHRVQYLDDRQTHRLPTTEDDRDRVACMAGFGAWADLVDVLNTYRAEVATEFASLLSSPPGSSESSAGRDLASPEDLGGLGYTDPEDAWRRIEAVRGSARVRTLPAQSLDRLRQLLPRLARAASQTVSPDAALARGLDLVESVARRAAYLALLVERPQALRRVLDMVAASPWAAEYLRRHPILLDDLVDDRALGLAFDVSSFARELEARLATHSGDDEARMNDLREAHQSAVFRLLANDLAGHLSVERLADELSALADATLSITLATVWNGLHRVGGEGTPRLGREGTPRLGREGTPRLGGKNTPRFAIVGYGKLGGKELGYASDLDLVFLFADDASGHGESTEAYVRLAQRLNHWLTAKTGAGALFETDLRLRPNGAAGLMVTSLAAFDGYLQSSAWTWELQALSRARFCAGDAGVGGEFEALRRRVLGQERDRASLARDVTAMRERMHAGHRNSSGLFDLKHDPGGMVDIEFIVQYLVLAESFRFPRLLDNLGNIALLGIAADAGLLDSRGAQAAQHAYREYRRGQHALRLAGERYSRVDPAVLADEAETIRTLWHQVFGPVLRL